MKNKFHLYPNGVHDLLRILQIGFTKRIDPKKSWFRWSQIKPLPKKEFKYYRLKDKDLFEKMYANPKNNRIW